MGRKWLRTCRVVAYREFSLGPVTFETSVKSSKNLEFKSELRAGRIHLGLFSIGMVFKAMSPGRCIQIEKREGLWMELCALQHLEIRRRNRMQQRLLERNSPRWARKKPAERGAPEVKCVKEERVINCKMRLENWPLGLTVWRSLVTLDGSEECWQRIASWPTRWVDESLTRLMTAASLTWTSN